MTRALCSSPLRLLTPSRAPGHAAWVLASTFGGGLLDGDRIDLSIDVGPEADCYFGTQASTKVYRSSGGCGASQAMTVKVAAGATCVLLPDMLACFADARFQQRLELRLDASASVMALDWLSSGRRARGERWAFDRFKSRIDATIGGKLVFRDALLLDKAAGPIDDDCRMGAINCFGTLLLLGPKLHASAESALARTKGDWPNERDFLCAVSAIGGGAVIRFAAVDPQKAIAWLGRRLQAAHVLIGADPWSRKF